MKEVLVFTGYSEKTAAGYPGTIVGQKGVREELKRLGIQEDLELAAKAIVAEILLLGEESNRLRAAEIIFKVLGAYNQPKRLEVNDFWERVCKEIGEKSIMED